MSHLAKGQGKHVTPQDSWQWWTISWPQDSLSMVLLPHHRPNHCPSTGSPFAPTHTTFYLEGMSKILGFTLSLPDTCCGHIRIIFQTFFISYRFTRYISVVSQSHGKDVLLKYIIYSEKYKDRVCTAERLLNKRI